MMINPLRLPAITITAEIQLHANTGKQMTLTYELRLVARLGCRQYSLQQTPPEWRY
jgi:hypothetical protein